MEKAGSVSREFSAKERHWIFSGSLGLVATMLISLIIISINPMKNTLAPMDILLAHQGWANAAAEAPLINPQRSDILDAKLPAWRYFRQELHADRIPLWNPLNQLGEQGIVNPVYSGVSVPFLFFVLTPNEAIGYTIATVANFLLITIGTYWLLCLLFKNRLAAALGAITFGFSGFNVAWAHWPHVVTIAWIPWILAFQFKYMSSGNTRWAVGFSVSVAMLVLGGFPFVGLLAAIASGMFAVSFFSKSVTKKLYVFRLLGLCVAALAAVCLILPMAFELFRFILGPELMRRTSQEVGSTILNLGDLTHLLGTDWGTRITVEKTFFSGIFPIVLSFFALPLLLFRPNKFALFGLMILLFVLLISYGIAPPELVSLIPGFAFNPWSRTGALIGLALAVLSAYSVTTIWELARNAAVYVRSILVAIFCLGFTLHVYQLREQFHLYNSSPPLGSYLPSTESIDHVVQRLSPLQSIVADRNFLTPGTVSNYGVPELFAHGFKTSAQLSLLGKLLRDPMETPTNSIMECRRMTGDRHLSTLAGIRFYLLARNCIEPYRMADNLPKQPSPDISREGFIGSIEILHSFNLKSLSVHFGTHQAESVNSIIRLELFKENELVASTFVDGRTVLDNAMSRFYFSPGITLPRARYQYRISLSNPNWGGRLSVWTNVRAKGSRYVFGSENATYRIGSKTIRGMPRVEFDGVVLGDTQNLFALPALNLESGISVIENPDVTGSAYYTQTLEERLATPEYKAVQLVRYLSTSMTAEYSGNQAGWIVFPIRFKKGWTASVDGFPVEPDLLMGVFPAIPVKGPAEVSLSYDTMRYLYLSLYGLVGFAACFCILLGLRSIDRKLSKGPL